MAILLKNQCFKNKQKIFGSDLIFIILTAVKYLLYALVFILAIKKVSFSFPLAAVMAAILASGFWRSFESYAKNKVNVFTLLLDLVLAFCFALLSRSGYDKLFMVYLIEGTAVLPKPLFFAYGILAITASMGTTTLLNFKESGQLHLPGLFEFLLYALVFGLVWSERRQRQQRLIYEKLTKELRYVNLQLKESMALNESLASEAERRQIVAEIHDSLGYHLTGLLFTLEAGKKLMSRDEKTANNYWDKAIELSRVAIHSVRELVSVKKESRFEFELISYLKEMAREVQSLTGLQIELEIKFKDIGLSGKEQFAMYRIFQEAITNTLRHANASRAKIGISGDKELLNFSYEDNGTGTGRIETGNGLKGMRDRISSMGGAIHFHSRPGAGFRIDGRIDKQRKDFGR